MNVDVNVVDRDAADHANPLISPRSSRAICRSRRECRSDGGASLRIIRSIRWTGLPLNVSAALSDFPRRGLQQCASGAARIRRKGTLNRRRASPYHKRIQSPFLCARSYRRLLTRRRRRRRMIVTVGASTGSSTLFDRSHGNDRAGARATVVSDRRRDRSTAASTRSSVRNRTTCLRQIETRERALTTSETSNRVHETRSPPPLADRSRGASAHHQQARVATLARRWVREQPISQLDTLDDRFDARVVEAPSIGRRTTGIAAHQMADFHVPAPRQAHGCGRARTTDRTW